MGTIASPFLYDSVACRALQPRMMRPSAISRYASWVGLPIRWSPPSGSFDLGSVPQFPHSHLPATSVGAHGVAFEKNPKLRAGGAARCVLASDQPGGVLGFMLIHGHPAQCRQIGRAHV